MGLNSKIHTSTLIHQQPILTPLACFKVHLWPGRRRGGRLPFFLTSIFRERPPSLPHPSPSGPPSARVSESAAFLPRRCDLPRSTSCISPLSPPLASPVERTSGWSLVFIFLYDVSATDAHLTDAGLLSSAPPPPMKPTEWQERRA